MLRWWEFWVLTTMWLLSILSYLRECSIEDHLIPLCNGLILSTFFMVSIWRVSPMLRDLSVSLKLPLARGPDWILMPVNCQAVMLRVVVAAVVLWVRVYPRPTSAIPLNSNKYNSNSLSLKMLVVVLQVHWEMQRLLRIYHNSPRGHRNRTSSQQVVVSMNWTVLEL